MQSAGAKADIVELLERGAWGGYQKFILGLVSLAMLMDGVANHALALAIPAMIRDWGVAADGFANVFAIGLIGQIIGAFLGGLAGDRFGCKPTLIASITVFGLATLAAASAQDMNAIFWLRFVDGVAIGAAIPTASALVAGLAPLHRRPVAVGFALTFIGVGAVVSSTVGGLVLPEHGWRGLFLTLGAPALLLALIFLVAVPENPLFLLQRPKRKAELLALLARCGHRIDPQAEINVRETRAGKAPLNVLFEPRLLRSTLWLWGGSFFVMLSSYIVFNWLPTVLSRLDFSLAQSSFGVSMFGSGSIVTSLLVGWTINRFGSKATLSALAIGGLLNGLALGAIVLQPTVSDAAVFAGLAFIGGFVGALINAIYIMAAHIYPNFARSTGLGGVASVGRFGAVASAFAGIITLNAGASVFFVFISAAMLVTLLCFLMVDIHIAGGRTRAGPEPAGSTLPG